MKLKLLFLYLILCLGNGFGFSQVQTDSAAFQSRKFEDLKEKAKKGKLLLEREKDFLCLGLKLTTLQIDGKPDDFEVCDNSTFKHLYLVYFSSNLGAENFYKPHKGQIYIVTHN